MTVNTQYFTNWQDGRQPNAFFGSAAPALLSLQDYLTKRWGGQTLGIYGVRTERGGLSWSTHAFGAAEDWRWLPSGLDYDPTALFWARAVLDDQIIPFLINNSLELGVQAIHDYYGSPQGTGRIWRSVRSDGRAYWRVQSDSSTGMGQSWARWLHIEVYESAWANGDPVEHKVGGVPPPVPEPAVVVPQPTLRVGSIGSEVLKLQQLCAFWGWGVGIAGDGQFGKQTDKAVRKMQTALHITSDGIYGPQSASAYRTFVIAMANL